MISFRKTVTVTHRWAGLTIGLFSVLLAVTGAGLALAPSLEPVLYRSIAVARATCPAPLPIDGQVAAARAAHPGGRVILAKIAPGTGGSTEVRFSDGESAFVDPCTAAILGQQTRWAGMFGRLEQLHRLLYWKDTAPNKLAKGVACLALALLSVVGGLYLWWPRLRGGWKRALALNPRLRGRAFTLNLHMVTGVYTGLVVFVVAMTGVPLAFDWAKQSLYIITASSPPVTRFASKAPAENAPYIPLETAWQELRQRMPAPVEAAFLYPKKPGDPMMVFALGPDAPHGEARSYLYLDAYDGRVLSFQPYATLSAGRKLQYWALAIHTGRAGGLPVEVILFLGMLGVPVMAYTGVESYLRRRSRRRAETARATIGAAAASD
jgi:uncharacterized iron-regulated membrane protein